MDWFPAMAALMVADLYFLAWPRQAKIALSPNFGEKRHFLERVNHPRSSGIGLEKLNIKYSNISRKLLRDIKQNNIKY